MAVLFYVMEVVSCLFDDESIEVDLDHAYLMSIKLSDRVPLSILNLGR